MAPPLATADVFSALADSRRREVLDVLREGEMSVDHLVGRLDCRQPQVSKHLKVLREVGLVRCRQRGRHRLYRVDPAALRPVRDWLQQYEALWNDRYDQLDDLLADLRSTDERMEGPR